MNEDDKKPHYRWPKFVLAGVVLGMIMAVIWVWFAVKKVESERDYSAPMPTTSPAH